MYKIYSEGWDYSRCLRGCFLCKRIVGVDCATKISVVQSDGSKVLLEKKDESNYSNSLLQ